MVHKKSGRKRKHSKIHASKTPAPVVIKRKRFKSTVPSASVLPMGSVVRKLSTGVWFEGRSGVLGGMQAAIECWRCMEPWRDIAPYVLPANGNLTPIGFTEMQDIYDLYDVLGCKVHINWVPFTNLHTEGGNDILIVRWDGGDQDDTGRNFQTTIGNKKFKKLFTNAQQADGLGTGNLPQKFKTYRKPIMLMSKPARARLAEDYPQNTDGSVSIPISESQWRLHISVMPGDLDINTLVYFRLYVKIDWYVRFSAPKERVL